MALGVGRGLGKGWWWTVVKSVRFLMGNKARVFSFPRLESRRSCPVSLAPMSRAHHAENTGLWALTFRAFNQGCGAEGT